ncbi:MAG: ATP-binding protein [bacterium]|nr:ATP-binding protein [bacterium]
MNAKEYITRSIEKTLIKAASQFPAVMLTGPRQSGKTTTLKKVFADTHNYVSFDKPNVSDAARNDPEEFLRLNPPPVIFDEIQHAPDLFGYIKYIIDSNRDACGQFILTGSQNLLLMEKITESLAGRVAVLRLLPLSNREISGNPGSGFPWDDRNSVRAGNKPERKHLWGNIIRGGYPALVTDPQKDTDLWHSSYVQTYLERDVRAIKQIGDLDLYQSFIQMLAAQSGNILNMSRLASDLGISVHTVKSWISVLTATYQVILLRPYFENFGKRLVKNPKVYFTDTGTLCYLTGIKTPEQAAQGPMTGAIFETTVITEVIKTYLHRGEEPSIYFWRTAKGSEVDLLIQSGEKIIPIEISSNATPRLEKVKEIKKLMRDFGDRISPGYLIHPGDIKLPMGDGIVALPFGEL